MFHPILIINGSGRKNKNKQIPNDIISEILIKLPIKSLTRFRSVCKQWNHLIQRDPYFASQHYLRLLKKKKKQPSMYITLSSTTYSGRNFTLNYSSGSEYSTIGIDLSPHVYYSMTNSCNGLVGVYTSDKFLMLNPSIMMAAELPQSSSIITPTSYIMRPRAAIGFDNASGQYKVVRIFGRDETGSSFGCQVLAISTMEWRSVEDPPFTVSTKPTPVQLSGVIYWTVEHQHVVSEVVLSFDLKSEKFSTIPHPKRGSSTMTLVSEIGGCLCIVEYSKLPEGVMTIWTLSNVEHNKWVELYNIDSVALEYYGWSRPLKSEDGTIVFYHCAGYCSSRRYFDPTTMKVIKVEEMMKGFFSEEHVANYTESIIWPLSWVYD